MQAMISRQARAFAATAAAIGFLSGAADAVAQAPGGKAPDAIATPKAAAQIDVTGHWVSVVSEDWVYRMVVAPKGDVGSIPVNEAGKKAAQAWDAAKDAADGDACKAYGAAGIMRMPGRLHISWQDDRTLRMDFDAGTQTRLLHFTGNLPPLGYTTAEAPGNFRTPPGIGAATLSGYSIAAWHKQAQSRGLGFGGPPVQAGQNGSLAVLTTNMSPGYLQSNGVPYSSEATLREFFDVVTLPGGAVWLIVTSIVEDPQYLSQPFVTSTQFKREPDGKQWDPISCGSASAGSTSAGST